MECTWREAAKIFLCQTRAAAKNEYWYPYNNPFGRPNMSTGGPLVCLFGPYFFQNEYSKPLPGPKFEYWPFESIPLDIIMRVYVRNSGTYIHFPPLSLNTSLQNLSLIC